MPSRRKIREAAVQFLYCADLEGGADPSDLSAPFWDFITESDQRKLLTAVFRMVHHLAQGRQQRLNEWQKRRDGTLSALAAWPEASDLADILHRIGKSEDMLSVALANLQKLSLDGEDSVVTDRLEPALAEFFSIDRTLELSRIEFMKSAEDHPQLSGQLEALLASMRRLQRISERLRMVENPEQFPDQADLAKLRDSKDQIQALRQATTELVGRVIQHKKAIDDRLADVIENFAPERIDPVDRAILRLSSYELMHTETPPKVILNEAVELAKRFGTTDSSRFVNGVLDKIAALSSE